MVAGLTASGLPAGGFYFAGFLPPKSGQRLKRLGVLLQLQETVVLYESPYRVEKLLGEMKQLAPSRKIVLARELTKKFEEYLRGTAEELEAQLVKRSIKGEFVVMIHGADEEPEVHYGEAAEGDTDSDSDQA